MQFAAGHAPVRQEVSRMEHGRLLTKSSTPVARTLLDEASLRHRIGGPHVMAEQLHKVADMTESGQLQRWHQRRVP
ncbi:Scr1 family TA system antitoxin-like transcriptional regulator [Streptomyces sp. NPDC058240]|uniref:Scr1 family TA system antitoxin-like transcriptional regulator n=1 Tax=Streptomyces sp. NPDC058240 TaxID=3346396 RepID=UPI0036EAF648